ncbi:MAG: DUF4252 domain-containing protein [Tidjanibacter sp.]|nr:DUF4252 domain-containing protein [Tidjanibacter sp.]MBR6831276.1 DUF4252 domain-containing protein [Tidjanibacter sp.]
MKRFILTLLILLPVMANAQSDSFKKYLNRHNGKSGFTTIEIPGQMLSLMQGENAESADVFKRTERLTLIICESYDSEKREEADEMIRQGGYQLMTAINNEGNEVRIYAILKKNNSSNEFLMQVTSEDDMVLISILGDIDLKDVSNFSNIGTSK